MKKIIALLLLLLGICEVFAQQTNFDPTKLTSTQKDSLNVFNSLKGKDRYTNFEIISYIFPQGKTIVTPKSDGSMEINIEEPTLKMTVKQLHDLLGKPDCQGGEIYNLSTKGCDNCNVQFMPSDDGKDIVGFAVFQCGEMRK
jgi:hypothetical protein